jgi:hypothetical protein
MNFYLKQGLLVLLKIMFVLHSYTGSNCQTRINECDSQPCLNGATCQQTHLQPAVRSRGALIR